MLYPRSGAGLFWSLDFLGKPSLAWLTASVFACGDGLVSYLGVGTASGNGRCFGYSPQASPREEGWIAIPWVHTYPAIPSAENTECLPCSVMKTRSGSFSPSSQWKLRRKSVGPAFCSDIFPNRSNCHVNGCLSFPFFFLIALFLTQAFQVMGNSHFQHLISKASSLYVSIQLLHRAIKMHTSWTAAL